MAHLGGHCNITHTDEGVLTYLIERYNIGNVIDIGCGPGGMKNVCSKHGVKWTGIDGDEKVKALVTHLIDFEKETLRDDSSFDLAWSVEFLEHVFEKYQDNYMRCFQKAKYVFCTAALPGKPGHHHVNCRNKQYWINVFEKYGFQYDEEITNLCKKHSTMRREFVQESGMFFYKIQD